MTTYLDNYGKEEAKRNRTIRFILLGVVGAALLAVVYYFVAHDYSEKQVAKRFIQLVNARDYQAAYKVWCPEPCQHYDFGRFSADWGPEKKISSPWKIDSVDSCRVFLTVNVSAGGSEMQSLSVERGTQMLSFAPAPECQEYKWHWKDFFRRMLRGEDKS